MWIKCAVAGGIYGLVRSAHILASMDIQDDEDADPRPMRIADAAPVCALNAATGTFMWPMFIVWDARSAGGGEPKIIGGTIRKVL